MYIEFQIQQSSLEVLPQTVEPKLFVTNPEISDANPVTISKIEIIENELRPIESTSLQPDIPKIVASSSNALDDSFIVTADYIQQSMLFLMCIRILTIV